MRQINDHMKEAIGTKPTPPPSQLIKEGERPDQPKPSSNPTKWNWTAIGVWSVMFFIAYKLFKFLFNLI